MDATDKVRGVLTWAVEQIERAKTALEDYLAATAKPADQLPAYYDPNTDVKRLELIERELGPLLEEYLESQISLEEFKSEVDGINKRNQLWGFKGIKGQMFFNMVYDRQAGGCVSNDDANSCALAPLYSAGCSPSGALAFANILLTNF